MAASKEHNKEGYPVIADREAEKVLVGAVLLRAALDALRGKDPGFMDRSFSAVHKIKARAWFGLDKDEPNMERSNGEYFTFAECCDVLNLNPRTVHHALRQLEDIGGRIPKLGAGIYTSTMRRIVTESFGDGEFTIPPDLLKHG